MSCLSLSYIELLCSRLDSEIDCGILVLYLVASGQGDR